MKGLGFDIHLVGDLNGSLTCHPIRNILDSVRLNDNVGIFKNGLSLSLFSEYRQGYRREIPVNRFRTDQ